MTLDEWNARYRSREALEDAPAALLVEFASPLAPGRALDLACGAGRNAVWLAARAWDVIAIDGAVEAIRLVPASPRITAFVRDLENGEPLPFDDESFDLVVILFYLHRPLFAEARRVLRRGGVIVTTALTRGRFGVSPGELAANFQDFDILHARDAEVAELVARRR